MYFAKINDTYYFVIFNLIFLKKKTVQKKEKGWTDKKQKLFHKNKQLL